jgi:hypothetical protein
VGEHVVRVCWFDADPVGGTVYIPPPDVDEPGEIGTAHELRADAMKMLAAVAACERHRAEAKP